MSGAFTGWETGQTYSPAVGHVAVVIGAVEVLAVPAVREVHVQLEERLDPCREDLRDERARGALPHQYLKLLRDDRAGGRRGARGREPDAGAASAGPVDDVRALRVVCVCVARDDLQAGWKRVHLVVAAQVVIELPLRWPDLPGRPGRASAPSRPPCRLVACRSCVRLAGSWGWSRHPSSCCRRRCVDASVRVAAGRRSGRRRPCG